MEKRGCQWSGKSSSGSPLRELDGETRLPMVTKTTMQWIPITALLLALTWRPSANSQILVHLLVCAGAALVVLSLFSIQHRVEPQYAVANRGDREKQITEGGGPWCSRTQGGTQARRKRHTQ